MRRPPPLLLHPESKLALAYLIVVAQCGNSFQGTACLQSRKGAVACNRSKNSLSSWHILQLQHAVTNLLCSASAVCATQTTHLWCSTGVMEATLSHPVIKAEPETVPHTGPSPAATDGTPTVRRRSPSRSSTAPLKSEAVTAVKQEAGCPPNDGCGGAAANGRTSNVAAAEEPDAPTAVVSAAKRGRKSAREARPSAQSRTAVKKGMSVALSTSSSVSAARSPSPASPSPPSAPWR